MDVLLKNNFVIEIEVLCPAENLLNECSGISSRTITSAQIARDNWQPFSSVVDCNTGFFSPQNHFLRARSLTRPSLTLRYHPPCTTFVSPLACFKLRLFCSLIRCKFCCFLRKAVRNGLSGLRTLQSYEHRPQTLSSNMDI